MSKRNKTLNSFFQVRTTETAETGPSTQTTDNTPNVRAELKPGDVESDPGKRIPIEELDPDIRDLARREYISMGPCQPTNHTYEKINGRSFHNYWFNDHRGWLEYSIEKKSAFCFYCFLFKQPRAENYGIEAFTRNGFKSWKDGPKVFNQHVGKHDSAHNKSRQHYEDFKNQRQNLSHVFDRGSQKQEEEYKARLLIILGIVNFLILQALAFRGHDESTSSMNKGNFKELLDLFIKKDPKVAKLFGDAGDNHKLTSHKIQKDLCKACAKETTSAILEEIGDSKFALLVDESRDASMKEQMAMCLRLVAFLVLYVCVVVDL